MSLTINLPDETAAALEAQAQARGLTIVEWIAELSRRNGSAAEDRTTDPRPIWEVIAGNMQDLPPEESEAVPEDGASQLDHYLYGHPKR